MRTAAPDLAPLFRSAGQARLLAELLLHDEELTIAELARRADLAYPSTWREVHRLTDAGMLEMRVLGRTSLVRANEHSPLTGPVRQILQVSHGPVPLLKAELSSIEHIDRAFVFGSFAARSTGTPGPAPHDIDLMVVGQPDPMRVYAACRRVGDQVGRVVEATILDLDEWSERAGFIAEVLDSPVIAVVGDPP